MALHASSPPADRTGWLQRAILQHLFPYGDRVKLALTPARWLQKLGVLDRMERVGLLKLLPATLRQMQAMLPTLDTPGSRLPEVLPPVGPKRATVALFVGCVGDAMFPGTTAATARVLQANGCEVHVPRGQNCCGAIHYHSGAEAPAVAFARRNMAALDPDRFDAIVTNVAGCGAMLKDYHHLLPPADHEPRRGSSARSATSASSWSTSARSRRRTPSRSGRPTTTHATWPTPSRSRRPRASCSA